MPLRIDILKVTAKACLHPLLALARYVESGLTESIHNPSTHIDRGQELRDGLHGTWSNNNVTAFHLFTFDTAEESSHIVAGLALEHVRAKLAGNSTNTYSVQLLMQYL